MSNLWINLRLWYWHLQIGPDRPWIAWKFNPSRWRDGNRDHKENERLRAALKSILSTRHDWAFQDGEVVGAIHKIAKDALADERKP